MVFHCKACLRLCDHLGSAESRLISHQGNGNEQDGQEAEWSLETDQEHYRLMTFWIPSSLEVPVNPEFHCHGDDPFVSRSFTSVHVFITGYNMNKCS